MRLKALFVSLFMSLLAFSAMADEISGAGATFPHAIYAKWAEAYKAQTGVGLNYQAIGSGGGIKQIKARTVTFGASDKPLSADELASAGLVQWPMVIGGVVPVVSIRGVGAGQLVLDGILLSKIYLGEITHWDDAAIVRLNPSLPLPHTPVAPVYRADGSGTNFLFTSYLCAVNPAFLEKVGANASVEWPEGIGAKGNEGVASMTSRTQGAIGYVEYAYAVQNNLAYVRMVNRAGKTVSPDFASFQSVAANADWRHVAGFSLVLVNQPGDNSWPITGASFILMPQKPRDTKAAGKALDFFRWAYQNGGAMAQSLDFVPMPNSVAALVEKSWDQISLKE